MELLPLKTLCEHVLNRRRRLQPFKEEMELSNDHMHTMSSRRLSRDDLMRFALYKNDSEFGPKHPLFITMTTLLQGAKFRLGLAFVNSKFNSCSWLRSGQIEKKLNADNISEASCVFPTTRMD